MLRRIGRPLAIAAAALAAVFILGWALVRREAPPPAAATTTAARILNIAVYLPALVAILLRPNRSDDARAAATS